jgi:hypothetical protein
MDFNLKERGARCDPRPRAARLAEGDYAYKQCTGKWLRIMKDAGKCDVCGAFSIAVTRVTTGLAWSAKTTALQQS